MASAWEAAIRDSLGMTRGLVRSQPPASRNVPWTAEPGALLLQLTRRRGGTIAGTQASIAKGLGLPASTVSSTIRRLVTSGRLERQRRRLSLPLDKQRSTPG